MPLICIKTQKPKPVNGELPPCEYANNDWAKITGTEGDLVRVFVENTREIKFTLKEYSKDEGRIIEKKTSTTAYCFEAVALVTLICL